MTRHGTIALVAGASSGIGKACAEYLRDLGCHVYGTYLTASCQGMRTESTGGGFCEMIPMDVRDDVSVESAVAHVLQRESALHILIDSAGYSLAGPLEDTSDAEAKTQFETNFFGALRLARAVLPPMREAGQGLIVQISSLAGLFPLPYQSIYSASKAALEAAMCSLRMEVRPFGIHVSVIAPPDVRTAIHEHRTTPAATRDGTVYSRRFERVMHIIEQREAAAPDPAWVLPALKKILSRKHPPARVVVGASYKTLAFAKRLTPARTIERVLQGMFSR